MPPEQFSFLRIALRANGGRFDDSLLALVRPVAGARQPRLVCTPDHAGFHLLVTVRPRNAQLLGPDTRPLVGLTKTTVDGSGAGGAERAAPRPSLSEGRPSPFARRRSDSDAVVEPERARAAMPPSPSVAREAAPPQSPNVTTASMSAATSSPADLSPAVESLRMTVLQLEQARREVATEAAALKSEQMAISQAEVTLARERRVLESERDVLRASHEELSALKSEKMAMAQAEAALTRERRALEAERDVLRASQEELAGQRRLFEDRMAEEMEKLAAEWRSLRTAQGTLTSTAAAAKAAAARQHMEAPASAGEKHASSLAFPASRLRRGARTQSGGSPAIRLFLAGVTLSLLLAACLFAWRHSADSRAAMQSSVHAALRQATTLVTARKQPASQVALRAPAAVPAASNPVRTAGAALTSWLMAAARSGVQHLGAGLPNRPALALPPPKRRLKLTAPLTIAGTGSRLRAQAGVMRRAVAAAAAFVGRLMHLLTTWSLLAALLVAAAWGIMHAVQQLVARLHGHRQGGKKKKAHHTGVVAAAHHGHSGGGASGGHVHAAKGAHSGGGHHGEASPVASPWGNDGMYGIERTPGGHWHSRRVHHDD